jgi:hypothetical protein
VTTPIGGGVRSLAPITAFGPGGGTVAAENLWREKIFSDTLTARTGIIALHPHPNPYDLPDIVPFTHRPLMVRGFLPPRATGLPAVGDRNPVRPAAAPARPS